MKRFPAALLVAFALVFSFGAIAQAQVKPEPVGFCQKVKGDVVAVNKTPQVMRYSGRKEIRELKKEGPIYRDDTIIAGADSSVQIMFQDGTTFVVGAESSMLLADYVYDFDERENNSLEVVFGPGNFRFLTGRLVQRNPDRFKLNSPLGILGIRGTEGFSQVTAGSPATERMVQIPVRFIEVRSDDLRELGIGMDNFDELFNAARGEVKQEEHGHIKGQASRPMIYTDLRDLTVVIPRDMRILVTRDGIQGDPMPLGGAFMDQARLYSIDKNAPVPYDFQPMLTPEIIKDDKESSCSSSSSSMPSPSP